MHTHMRRNGSVPHFLYNIQQKAYPSITEEASDLRKRILVVDDDEDLLLAYRLTLEKENNIIFTTSDVYKAQEIVKKMNIDLAILDYVMMNLRGDQLARRLIRIKPDIKIIFISGYYKTDEIVKKLEFKIYGVFSKPLDPMILEKLALSNDHADFIQNSPEISALNLYSNIA